MLIRKLIGSLVLRGKIEEERGVQPEMRAMREHFELHSLHSHDALLILIAGNIIISTLSIKASRYRINILYL